MSTSYHPQSNGQTERANRVLEDALRAYVNGHQNDWDQYLAPLEFAVNSSVHSSTGVSAFAMNGVAPRSPLDVALGRQPQALDPVPSVSDLVNQAKVVMEDARGFMMERQAKQKEAADRRRRDEKYAVGDQVMLSTAAFRKWRGKLKDPYIGPFRVKEVKGDVNVVLELPASMRIHTTFHVEKLKRFVPSGRDWPGRQQLDRPAPVLNAEGNDQYEVEYFLGKRVEMRRINVQPESDVAQDGDQKDEQSPTIARRSGRLAAKVTADNAKSNRKTKARFVLRPVTMYLVKWKGYPEDDVWWVPEDNMQGAPDAIAEYEFQQQLAASEDRGEEVMGLRVDSRVVEAANGISHWSMLM
jgi:hypothetical protein